MFFDTNGKQTHFDVGCSKPDTGDISINDETDYRGKGGGASPADLVLAGPLFSNRVINICYYDLACANKCCSFSNATINGINYMSWQDLCIVDTLER